MRKNRIGIFLSLLLLVGFTACTETKSNSKLVINEVLVDNQSNFQDDIVAGLKYSIEHIARPILPDVC
mgnify:CR=1 FL=1